MSTATRLILDAAERFAAHLGRLADALALAGGTMLATRGESYVARVNGRWATVPASDSDRPQRTT